MRPIRVLCLAVSAVVALATPAKSAPVLFSQPYAGPTFGYVSDSSQYVADDFTLLSDSILTDFHWWGGYTFTPPGTAPPPEDWNLYIFADLPSLQGFLLYAASPLTNVVRVDTGDVTPSGNAIFAYTADLSIPLTVTAGTHYANLWGSGGATASQRAAWTTVLGATPVAGSWVWVGSWGQYPYDQAFEITGTAVPEPASLLLLGTGLLGLARWRKRRT